MTWPTRQLVVASCRRFGWVGGCWCAPTSFLSCSAHDPLGAHSPQGEDSIAAGLSWQDGPKTGAEAAQMVADSVMGAR